MTQFYCSLLLVIFTQISHYLRFSCFCYKIIIVSNYLYQILMLQLVAYIIFMLSTSRLSLKLDFSFGDANPEWCSSMMWQVLAYKYEACQYIVAKLQVPITNTSWDMNYFPPFIFPYFGQVQTDYRQKAMHKSPPYNLHRWAQKLKYRDLYQINQSCLTIGILASIGRR